MFSISEDELESKIESFENANVILIDLNSSKAANLCDEVIYLLEPSTIKLNKLIRKDRNVFERLKGKKIILNKAKNVN